MKGKLKLNGIEYDCEVRDGVRYVNGMNPDEFVDHLAKNGDWTALHDLVIIGMNVVRNTMNGSCQQLANELYWKKVN